MPGTTERRRARGGLRVGLTGLLLTLALGSRGPSDRTTAAPAGLEVWKPGRAVPIASTGGHARFTVPTPERGARTLVIVSSLAKTAGPFPMHLAARPIDPARVVFPLTEPTGRRNAPDLSAPSLPPAAPRATTIPAAERTFHLMVRDGDVVSPSNYLAVRSILRRVGKHVQVYVDERDEGRVADAVVRDVIETFDNQVHPVAERTFGRARDVDGDGRFTVLMSGWLTRLGGGRHAVDGFVRGADLDMSLPTPFSNHCDMMYLSTALEAGPHLRTVVAHEYTHAVTFTSKSSAAAGVVPLEEEGWLDEALAHLVEDLHGFSRSNLDYRVSAFLSRPEHYQLVVEDYYAADLFRSHGNRGATYLFLRWCADRFGSGLPPSLIRSGRRGVSNLEAATGTPFADLYRGWSVALYATGLDPLRPDRDGFHSIDLRMPFDDWELAGPRTVTVSPGSLEDWTLAGTSSRYFIVEASPTGAVDVEISSGPQAELQVTALTLPPEMGVLDLNVSMAVGANGEPFLRATIRERNGAAVRLSALAWEPLVPGPDPHAPTFRRSGLDRSGIDRAFGTSALPPFGRLDAQPIPCAGALPTPGDSLIVKVIGIDAAGRRVSAWAEIESEGESTKPRPKVASEIGRR